MTEAHCHDISLSQQQASVSMEDEELDLKEEQTVSTVDSESFEQTDISAIDVAVHGLN